MKTLIVYSSKSGNTRKLAKAVSDFLPGENVLKPATERPDPAGYDFVVIGFWLQAGKADPVSYEYLEKLAPSNVFLFASHGAGVDSAHARNAMEGAEELVAASQIFGTFNCQGEVKAEFLAKAEKKDPPPPWIKDAPGAVGHPNGADIGDLQKELERAVTLLRSKIQAGVHSYKKPNRVVPGGI